MNTCRLKIDQLICDYSDYKDLLRDAIAAHRDIPGYKTAMARAAGCQKSFISQVLGSHVNLSEDHAAGLALFWELDLGETESLLDLVRLARAGTDRLRALLRRRLDEAGRRARKIENHFTESTVLDPEKRAAFYMRWFVAATYMLIAVEGMTDAAAIARRLNLDTDTISSTLDTLFSLGLVGFDKGRPFKKERQLFLAADSPYRNAWASAWRQISAVRLHTHDTGRELFYTTLYSMSQANIRALHDEILRMIEASKKLAYVDQPEEDLICFNVDFFRV